MSEPAEPRWSGDAEAWAHLKPNFTNRAGMLRPKPGYEPTGNDFSALDYLAAEWDYSYDLTAAA